MKRSPWTEPPPADPRTTPPRARDLSPDPWAAPSPPIDDETDRELVAYLTSHCLAVATPPRLPCSSPRYAMHLKGSLGLDPAVYHVTVAVDRVDGDPLTEDEVELLRAALAPYRALPPGASKPRPAKAAAPAKKRVGLF